MRIDKPIGTLLLLWPTLWALWIAAEGPPSALIAFVFITGVFVMRSAGCVINDITDRDFDPHVERTRTRPLAAGTVTVKEAVGLAIGLGLTALLLVSALNPLTIALSVAGGALATTYPLMKRITYLPQAYLGVAFGWGIPMAFAAVQNTVPLAAWYLLAVNILWAIAYDTMYAMADREDDLKIGVKSSAILFGQADRAMVGLFQLTTLGLMGGLGLYLDFGIRFAAALALAFLFCAYQQHLIRTRGRTDCLRAFLNNNWVGGVLFAGFVLEYL
ncbi:MAG: 4-hydroxybenzoate octaprenyltransferase [Gammaproteobacteria bacterium]|nr:4-hydroxybenzoate octaprenyltransferase [Gammaproteobacteria bacterium]